MGLHKNTQDFLKFFRGLELSKKVGDVRADLAMLFTNRDIFAETIVEQLTPSVTGVPYHIDDPDISEDSEQVAVIKKLSNILYNVEKILTELEGIELTDEMYTAELAVHIPQIAKNACRVINQVYDAVQLVNNSSASIQALMGPQIEGLQAGCSYLSSKLSSLTVSGSMDTSLGELMGDAISQLPKERLSAERVDFFDISKIIVNIPGHLNQLQNLLKGEPFFPEVRDFIAPEDYQHSLRIHAALLSSSLRKVTLETGPTQVKHLISAAVQLNTHGAELLNSAASLTEEGYLQSIEKLNALKHDILPNIISELESLEESLGLRPGSLTEPALESAKTYYEQLAAIVKKIPEVAKQIGAYQDIGDAWYLKAMRSTTIDKKKELLIDPNLSTLMDSTFIEKRQNLQTQRLHEAKTVLHETEQSLEAAKAFFTKIASLDTFYNDGQISSISIEDKMELAHLYKQFQSYMAANNPELDATIVNYLNLTSKEIEQLGKEKEESASFALSVWSGLRTLGGYSMVAAQKMAAGSADVDLIENEFATILEKQDSVLNALRREINTERQRVTLIESAQAQLEKGASSSLGQQTILERDVPIPQFSKYRHNQSPRELYKQSLGFAKEAKELSQAKAEFDQFIKRLNESPDKSKPLSQLSPEEKEILRALYKKFQPYICLLAKKDDRILSLNHHIVTSLMNESPIEDIEGGLTLSQILDTQEVISSYFTKQIANREAIKNKCLSWEMEGRKQSPTPITLEPIGVTAKNTLLAQLSAAKLSDEVRSFLLTQIIPSLKENLSEDILKELHLDGDLSNLKPYPASEEASQVSLYKNMINSFLHLEQALKGFEAQGQHEETKSTLEQALFLGTTGLAVGGAIAKAFSSIKALSDNPQIHAVLQQGRNIVAPMKKVPGLAALFEMNLFEETLVYKQTLIIQESIHKLQLSLADLAKSSNPYDLPEKYQEIKKNFMEQESAKLNEAELLLGLPAGSLLAKLEMILDECEEQIREELADNPLEALDELREAFYYDDDLDLSDEDFQAMFEKNYAILQPYLEKIDPEYYTSALFDDLETPADFERALTKIARDSFEKVTQEIYQHKANAVYVRMLSQAHELQRFLNQTQKEITTVVAQQNTVLAESAKALKKDQEAAGIMAEEPDKLEGLIDKLFDLQFEITRLNPDSDFSQLVEDKQNLTEAIEEIKTTLANVGSIEGIANLLASINQLQTALRNTAAGSHELIIASLKSIRTEFGTAIIKQADDAEFNLGLEPGSLSTKISEHFDKFYKGMLDHIVDTQEQDDLMLLVDTSPTEKRLEYAKQRLATLQATIPKTPVEEKTKEMNIKLAQAKITDLSNLLDKEKNSKVPDKIKEFKQQKFEQYVKSILKESLGAYADAFYQEMKPSLARLQEEILKDISIQDDIQGKIAASSLRAELTQILSEIANPEIPTTPQNEAIKQAYKQFSDANTELLKVKEFKASLRMSMDNNLFINLMVKEIDKFEAKISQFSKEYKPGDDMTTHREMVSNFMKTLDIYKFLAQEASSKQYQAFQAERQRLIGSTHPLQIQKLEFMGFFEQHILDTAQYKNKAQIMEDLDYFKTALKDYDKLIRIYDLNQQLIKGFPPIDKTKDPALPEIRSLQSKHDFAKKMNDILVDPRGSPAFKLGRISEHLESEQTHKSSLVDKIGSFFKLIVDKIRSVLTGESPKEEAKDTISQFNAYKQRLHKILPKQAEAVEELAEDQEDELEEKDKYEEARSHSIN